ncbi:hypothetical protein [uncultured Enterobacter sp.]|uniref:hypothetical protein n=1 Tax=uncultured Enterobacter sp. TaxID=238202 RepID=UPI00261B9210|nr:hypothetical protein [uncultured Enterobacter sp.]
MSPVPVGDIYLLTPLMGCYHTQPAALWRVPAFQTLNATFKTDRANSRALARHSTAKKIFRRQKSHYTAPACGFWIIKIFQFYFSANQTARQRQRWRLCGKPELKRLKRISFFFSEEGLRRNQTDSQPTDIKGFYLFHVSSGRSNATPAHLGFKAECQTWRGYALKERTWLY